MGLSFSSLISSSKEILAYRLFGLTENVEKRITIRSISFDSKDKRTTLRTVSFKKEDLENSNKSESSDEVVIEECTSVNKCESENGKLETTVLFKSLVLDSENFRCNEKLDEWIIRSNPVSNTPKSAVFSSPRPVSELDAAALKLQKVYKSYRTRRNLADCAVVVEELWWKALDFAALKRSSVSFFNIGKPETAVSRWARARTRAAKVGKGLSKDEKAQKLALRHWLEAIDPRHRYGHNLHLYYDVWFNSESAQPFFYWLDVGDGKEVNLENCPRTVLQHQCIKYLGPKEREAYEVIVESGRLVYRQNRGFLDCTEGSKWIFVLSTSRTLYVGEKKKGLFQHSSFLAGGATTASGRLVARNGILEAIWPYSGHYRPTEENFMEFISFLEEHHLDLTNVKRCAVDDDEPPVKVANMSNRLCSAGIGSDNQDGPTSHVSITTVHREDSRIGSKVPVNRRLSCKWTSGTGPRIGCVRDYPTELQFKALEQVNLSPRIGPASFVSCAPIPSPRPSPKVHLSPRISCMGLPSPRLVVKPTDS